MDRGSGRVGCARREMEIGPGFRNRWGSAARRRAHANATLGAVYLERGRLDDALKQFDAAAVSILMSPTCMSCVVSLYERHESSANAQARRAYRIAGSDDRTT